MSSAKSVIFALAGLLAVLLAQAANLRAQEDLQSVRPESNDIRQPIKIIADHQEIWQQGNTTVTALRGGRESGGLVQLVQGELQLAAENMVVVDTVTNGGHDVHVYAKSRVRYISHGHGESFASHHIRIKTISSLGIKAPYESKVTTANNLMREALAQIDPAIKNQTSPVSLQVHQDSFIPPDPDQPVQSAQPLTRRIRIRPRSSQPLQFDSGPSRDVIPAEQVYSLTGGVNVLIEGVQADFGGQLVQPGVLDLSADRVVIWTQPNQSEGLAPGSELIQSAAASFQVYLEGNILIRQGKNTVTASHAFFDANNDRALMLNAELRAYLPQTGGEFRVRAERLRRLSENKFHAQNAWTSTSPYGKPSYRVQAREIFVEPGPVSPFTEIDPQTGLPKNGPPLWVTALDTKFVVGDTPLLWLPRLTAPAEDPNIPIRRAVVKHDRIFGLQVKTVWNLTKILGQPKQAGMQWDLVTDFFSERGLGAGVNGKYDIRNRAGRANGNATILYQYDDGIDNLGLDRRTVETDNHRGGVIWRHKQHLPGQALLFGEIGYLSDRNYFESYHEPRYDSDKDAETIIGARQDSGAWSGMLWGRTRLNEIEATADWLPRGDLYNFSQPLVDGVYWSSHSSVGYGKLKPGDPPTTPSDPFTPLGLPYVNDAAGLVAMSRHQIEAPFFLGPVKFNPFVMGEAAFWNEGLTANDIDRYLVSGGIQANLSATKIMPFVRNDLWNLNGLAHKTDLFLEYRLTDASRNLSEISQYNEIDDNSQERFRGRYPLQIFPGIIPAEFDPRYYAVRNGAGLWVSAPYNELVEDQETLRLRWRNRLQTKVGMPGAQRIRDWMIWETGFTWFPQADRDNFGEDIGLIYGNYRWNVNDRTSFLANGVVDLFENSQEVWSFGVLSQRSTRGSLYVGYRAVKARNYLDSQTLVSSYSYRMSPKWISTGAFSYDVAAGTSRGSSLTFSRVGLDWVLHIGFGIDPSKDNVGLAFALEPRFGPPSPTNLSYLLGLNQ